VKSGRERGRVTAVKFILAVIGVVVLLGTGLAAQQVPQSAVQTTSQHDAHVRADNLEHGPAPAAPSAGLAHAFTINVYISD
jgi:hypothetical protein